MGSALRALSAVSAAVGLFITTGGVATADSSVTVVGLRPARQLVGRSIVITSVSAANAYAQFPYAESFPSASGGTKPRVVLLSYENNVDSSEHAERVRTLRSVDGGASFTELADSVPIKSMTQLADGSLVTVNYRTARLSEPAPGPIEAPTPSVTEAPTPTATDPSPTPSATEAPTPTVTEASPTPSATEAPTPTATDPSPTPSATDASPSPEASEPATTSPSPTTTDAPADPTTDPVTAGAPSLAAAADTPSPSTSTPPVAPTGTGTTTFVTTYWRSTDDGATWTQSEGSLVSPFRLDKVWFHRGIVHGADGSLLAPTYGYAENDTRYRSMLARSLDGGATWRIIGTIAATPADSTIREGMSEPSVARLASGDLLAVFRQDSTYAICASSDRAGGGAPLMSARSTDDGLTWSQPQPLVGQGLTVTNTRSVDPQLTAMPGGQLLLTYGRPNTRTLVSEDGTGRTWTDLTVTNPGVTSGYASVVPMGGRRALLVGDNGSNWCFQPDSTATVGIWARSIELRPSDTRRIDLRSRYLAGTLRVTTDLTARPTAASSVAAALDGSVEAQAGATRSGRSGYYTLDLGTPTALTAASISLPDAHQSAAVDVSTDGRTWRTVAGWVSTGDYRSLTDRSFWAATMARWVRVRVTSTGATTTLGEVELRTTASTFEDDVVGYAPAGYVALPRTAPRVTVVDGGAGLSSERAVRLQDVSAAETAVLAVGAPLATSRSVELGLRPARIASAILVSLEGRRGTAYQRALHLGVFPDGSVRRWTGSTWTRLSAPGLVRPASWTGFRVVATGAGADVYVNGHRLPRVALAAGTTGFTGVQLSSGGLGPVGDDVYLDQVRVG